MGVRYAIEIMDEKLFITGLFYAKRGVREGKGAGGSGGGCFGSAMRNQRHCQKTALWRLYFFTEVHFQNSFVHILTCLMSCVLKVHTNMDKSLWICYITFVIHALLCTLVYRSRNNALYSLGTTTWTTSTLQIKESNAWIHLLVV